MIKILIGFIFGVMITSALADGISLSSGSVTLGSAVLMTSIKPDNSASVIHVDQDGYVICSDHKKP